MNAVQPVPAAPTDSIYKFFAIGGVWMLIGLLAFFGYLFHVSFQAQERAKLLAISSDRDLDLVRIEARRASLRAGKTEENKLSWMPLGLSIKQELSLLRSTEKSIRSQEPVELESEDPSTILRQLSSINAGWYIALYAAISILFLCFGLRGWWKRVQKPSDIAIEIDLQLKAAALEKTKLEVQALRRHSGRKRSP